MINFSSSGLLQGLASKDVKEALQKTSLSVPQKYSLQQNPQESIKRDAYQNITTLLKELSTQSKSPSQVLNTLIQPELAKPMQQVSTQLDSLLLALKADKNFSKFAPLLDKLLLDIRQFDSKGVQKGLSQAGVNFEAKLAKPLNISVMPPALKSTITDIKTLLLGLEAPVKSSMKEQIQTLLHASRVNKDFMSGLVQTLGDSKALLANQEAKPGLNLATQKELSSLLLKLEALSKAPIQQVAKSDVKQLLAGLQKNLEPLLQAQKNQTQALSRAENLLSATKADTRFVNEAKSLIAQIKAMPAEKGFTPGLLEKLVKLEDLAQKSALIESKIHNKTAPAPFEISSVKASVKQELQTLLTELKNSKSTLLVQFGAKEKSTVLQEVQNILKMPDFFPSQGAQNLSGATLSEQINRMVNLLKSQIASQNMPHLQGKEAQSLDPYLQSTKLSLRLEEVLKDLINTKQLVPEQKLSTQVPIKEVLSKDIKGVLLALRGELQNSNAANAREILGQVERALAQVEYHQLVSLSSGTYTSYLPLLWDGLREGSISLKKLKENRFFCEINLTLKDYGKVDLMLMLFEDVHVNISIFANNSFLSEVKNNIRLLKQGLNSLGLIPANIQYFDEKQSHKKEETRTFANNAQIGSGFNLMV